MVDCSFCGNNVPRGTGTVYVLKTGKVLNFDKSKCERNMLRLKRKARNLKWTKHYEKGIKKENVAAEEPLVSEKESLEEPEE